MMTVHNITTVEGLTLKDGNEYSEDCLSQLEDFFVNAPVGTLIADGEHKVLRINAALLEVLGFENEAQAQGKDVFSLFDAKVKKTFDEKISSDDDCVNNLVAVIRKHEGEDEEVYVDTNARFNDGKVVYSRWFVRPLRARVLPSTDRDVERDFLVLPEKAKQERFMLLNDFFENAPAGVHFVGLNGLILRSNMEEKKLLGYGDARDEYDGAHVSKIHWDKKKIEFLLTRLAESVPVIDEKAFMIKRDGSNFVARIYSGLRLKGGAFENTRCFLFADPDQDQEPVEMQAYTFPSFSDYQEA